MIKLERIVESRSESGSYWLMFLTTGDPFKIVDVVIDQGMAKKIIRSFPHTIKQMENSPEQWHYKFNQD